MLAVSGADVKVQLTAMDGVLGTHTLTSSPSQV